MENKTDVIIIGAGVIGLACAHYLSKMGCSVRILEKGAVFSGASHGNCGLIFSSHLSPLNSPGIMFSEFSRMIRSDAPVHVEKKAGARFLIWLSRFLRNANLDQLVHGIGCRERLLSSSRSLYPELLKAKSMNCDDQRKGILVVFKNQESMESYGSSMWYRERYNINATPLIGSDLYRLEPSLRDGLYGAWFYEDDTHLRPDKLGLVWSRSLKRRKVDIRENTMVIGFRSMHNRIDSVVTSKGTFKAKHFVMANGAWAPKFAKQLKLKLPIQPAKGYSLTSDDVKSDLARPVLYHDKRIAVTPWDSGTRIGGILELSGWNHAINPQRMLDLKTDSLQLADAFPRHARSEEWIGFRPLTVDDLPIIGPSPYHVNLFLACGHGMTGFSMAPATGKLIAEMVCKDATHIDPEPYSVSRFLWRF